MSDEVFYWHIRNGMEQRGIKMSLVHLVLLQDYLM